MLRIKPSNTKESSIIAMGKRLSQASTKTGNEYLMLNRGVNSVVTINLDPVIKTIDFNSPSIQVYAGSKGNIKLRDAINQEYFANKADINNIIISGGGISGLDICFQNLLVKEILIPNYFWGTYVQLLNLREQKHTSYPSYEWLFEHCDSLRQSAVVICDPGNPLGEKYNDTLLLQLIEKLNAHGVAVLFDSPYRRLFYDARDDFYQKLVQLDHVIIIESFSKSLGLSGQRIGFIHSSHTEFIKEASLRIAYASNGINGFAQTLVQKLLTSTEGKHEVDLFKVETCKHIKKNIEYLTETKLLSEHLYVDAKPLGIFVGINQSQEKLFQHRIGSVNLDYFTLSKSKSDSEISRILVSIPHEKFVSFFRTLTAN